MDKRKGYKMNELTLNNGFSVEYSTPEIKINNQKQFETALNDYVERYKNLVITKDTLKGAKKSHTELNKLKKAIDDERKRIKKDYNQPLKTFENTLKAYVNTIDNVRLDINKGIAELDEKQRLERLNKVKDLIEEMAVNYGVEPQQVQIEKSWTNKTISNIQLAKEVKNAMLQIKHDEEDLRLLEKECTAKNLPSAPYKLTLKDVGLLKTLENVNRDYELLLKTQQEKRLAEKIRKELEQKRLLEETKQINETTRLKEDTGEIVKEYQVVTFKLKGTKEQINFIAQQVKKSGVTVLEASERETIFE